MSERLNPIDDKPPITLPASPDKRRLKVEKIEPIPSTRHQQRDTVEISEAARELLERSKTIEELDDSKEHLE